MAEVRATDGGGYGATARPLLLANGGSAGDVGTDLTTSPAELELVL